MNKAVTSVFSGPFQTRAYIEAIYFALLDREPDPSALVDEGSPIDLQSSIVNISRSEEFANLWHGSGVWGDGALRDLLEREPRDKWKADEWISVLAGLFVASSRRSRSNHDRLFLRQEEFSRLIQDEFSQSVKAVKEESERSLLEIGNKYYRDKAAKDDRLAKEHIALSQRLGSIEERIYQQPNLEVEGCKTYAIAEHLLLLRSLHGSFLVIRPDLVGGALGRGEFWDMHVKSAIDRYSDPNRVAIDAGAYIGFHSVYLASKFKKVYAFEPQKFVWRLAVANVALNNMFNVEVLNAALYSEDTRLAVAAEDQQQIPVPKLDLDIDYSKIGNAAAVSFAETDRLGSNGVPAHKLDSLGIKDVGFIKVDAQGCDLHVLRGAAETIRRDRPVITFEFEEKLSSFHDCNWADYSKFFNEFGYSLSETAHSGPDQWDYLAVPQK